MYNNWGFLKYTYKYISMTMVIDKDNFLDFMAPVNIAQRLSLL